MASKDRSFFCAGCGETQRVKESKGRRKINSSSSERVFTLLKSLITCELDRRGSEEDVDVLMQHATYMCKNCFYAYEKHINSLEVINHIKIQVLNNKYLGRL